MASVDAERNRRELLLLGVLVLVVLPSQLLWVATQNFVFALAPVLAVAGIAFLRYAPPRWCAIMVLAIVVFLDDVNEHPFAGEWTPPTIYLSRALYKNILLVTGMDVAVGALFLSVALRRTKALFLPLRRFLWLFIATIVWLQLWGAARGGDLRMGFYQYRLLMWVPALVALFYYAFDVRRDLKTIAWLLVSGAAFKALLAVYFRKVYCVLAGLDPPTATTHSDTVLFTSGLLLVLTMALELKSRVRLLVAAVVAPIILMGLVANDRRLAYASLGMAIAAVYLLLRDPIRRWVNRGIFVSIPVGVLYLIVGWNRTGGIWGPAATIAAMAEGGTRDASTATRDIENYNLVVTWKTNVLLGQGWGHKYYEMVEAYSISEFFEIYRYIAHNGVLWLASVSGMVGLIGLWMVYALTSFFAARSSRRLPHGIRRAFALWAFGLIPIVLSQAYGDMGFHSWHGIVQFSLATAIVAQFVANDESGVEQGQA